MTNDLLGTITLSTKTEEEMCNFIADVAESCDFIVNRVEEFAKKLEALSMVYQGSTHKVGPILEGVDILNIDIVSTTSISLDIRALCKENIFDWSYNWVKKYPYLSLSGHCRNEDNSINYDFKDCRVLQVINEQNIDDNTPRKRLYISNLDEADNTDIPNNTLYTFNIIGDKESDVWDFCKKIAICDGLNDVSSTNELVDKIKTLIDSDPQKRIKSSILPGCHLSHISCILDRVIEVKFTASSEAVDDWSKALLRVYPSLSLFGYAAKIERMNMWESTKLLLFKTVKRLSIYPPL